MEEEKRNFRDIFRYQGSKPWLSPDYLMYYSYSSISFMGYGETIGFDVFVRNDYQAIIRADYGSGTEVNLYAETNLRMNSSNRCRPLLQWIMELEAFDPTYTFIDGNDCPSETFMINHPVSGLVQITSLCGGYTLTNNKSDELLTKLSKDLNTWRESVKQAFFW